MSELSDYNDEVRRRWMDSPLDSSNYQREMSKTSDPKLGSWSFSHHVYPPVYFSSTSEGMEILKGEGLSGRSIRAWKVIDPLGKEMSMDEFCDQMFDLAARRIPVTQGA